MTVTLSDGINSSPYTFNLAIVNTAPVFTSALQSQSLMMNQNVIYLLPATSDPNTCQTVTIGGV